MEKKRSSFFDGFMPVDIEQLESYLPQGSNWTTEEVLEALKRCDFNITKRKLQYRIAHKKFTPLPNRLGKSYLWKRPVVKGVLELLNNEELNKEAKLEQDIL